MAEAVVAAVDLGASSGRVMLGRVGDDELALDEVARFDNSPVEVRGRLHWDVLGLYREIVDGLRTASAREPSSVGIDSWAVDYGLLDADGRLLANPVHYRDARTDGVLDALVEEVGAERLYDVTGLQFLPINTAVQLRSQQGEPTLAAAATLLLIPDLLVYWLTGVMGAERTNASTTQLLDVRTGRWATQLCASLGIDATLLPDLVDPATVVGPLSGDVADAVGLPETRVVTVASHDTASAVAAVPADGQRFAYVSCGTWSLVGVELDHPLLSRESREANFTNERGLDGTIRYLRNVMGLWLLQQSMDAWRRSGHEVRLTQLLADAEEAQPLAAVVDPDDDRFLPPGDMPDRIAAYCRETDQPVPSTPGEVARCIVDSLALAYRHAVLDAQRLSGRDVDVVHVVGGGCRNELLCQLTADACGLPVVAGPAEATALGNALVQGRALGAVAGDLEGMRRLVRRHESLRGYEPRGDTGRWERAAARLP